MNPLSPADRDQMLTSLGGLETARIKVAALNDALTVITEVGYRVLRGDGPDVGDEERLRRLHAVIAEYDFTAVKLHLERVAGLLERVWRG